MQDIHSIIGGGGLVGSGGIRLFSGGDRRNLLRSQNQLPAEMKCPRCDSLNTKFCYYNNYNLSQPRHFCKSCRRYWTKGGVLRNVPVGGGIRKNKRSKVKTSSPGIAKEHKSSSNSSSGTSNLTGAAPVTATPTVTGTSPETEFTPDLGYLKCLSSDILPESRFYVPLQNASSNFDQVLPELETSPELDNFMNMITSSSLHNSSASLNYNASETMTSIPYRSSQQELQQMQKLTNFSDELRTDIFNRTVQFDLPIIPNLLNGGEYRPFDWQASGDFEPTGAVDDADQFFWNHNQWSDHDNPLYLP